MSLQDGIYRYGANFYVHYRGLMVHMERPCRDWHWYCHIDLGELNAGQRRFELGPVDNVGKAVELAQQFVDYLLEHEADDVFDAVSGSR